MNAVTYRQRSKVDRRSEEPAEGGVWPERRRRPERRMVQVSESTFSEWVNWMARRHHPLGRKKASEISKS